MVTIGKCKPCNTYFYGIQQLVVIGGGAAGFFCAINVAMQQPNTKIILIEKTGKLLSKVKISGGGRCNVTHACYDIVELSKKYPRGEKFVKKAFHWFNTQHTINWFAKQGVVLTTEADGRMFPATNTSETIIQCFLQLAATYNISIYMHTEVVALSKQNNLWQIQTNKQLFTANNVCVACGGFSKIEHFTWLQQLQHTVATPVPSLFTFNMPKHSITSLMGVSVNQVQVKIVSTKHVQTGPILITHWGLSGPAVLKTSAWAARDLAACNYTFSIVINWLYPFTEATVRGQCLQLRQQLATQKIYGKNPFQLPERLWQYLLQQIPIDAQKRWADINNTECNNLISLLTAHAFSITGKTTFKEEFVTAGGINLQEIDVNTMQSKLHEGLYFAGEIMDVDGVTGGFNFQHAWTSAYVAATAISNSVTTG